MLLAEGLIEKDYIVESIKSLSNTIKDLLVAYDQSDEKVNKEKLKGLFKKLENLYLKYQQLDIMIGRAQALSTVFINETEISLKDAMIIKEVMDNKLECFIGFLNEIRKEKPDKFVCIDIDYIEKMIEMLKIDIKTLNIKIQTKIWNTEVK